MLIQARVWEMFRIMLRMLMSLARGLIPLLA